MTKFIVTYPSGETRTSEARYINPRFINGYWSYDKEGQEPYTRTITNAKGEQEKMQASLGDTMYFQIETKDLEKGDKIRLQLMEYDYFWWMGEEIDEYNPDDKNFPDKPVIIYTKVGELDDCLTTIAVQLDEKWEAVIQDDHDDKFSIGQTIELYFKVEFTDKNGTIKKATLPPSKKDYLHVGYNENRQTLFYQPDTNGMNLPELFTLEGEKILFLEDGKDKLAKLGRKAVVKSAPLLTHHIAVGKLKQGYLVTDKGNVYHNPNAKIHKYDTFTNDDSLFNEGKMLKDLERRRNFTITKNGQRETTKGISQYDYFSKNGTRVTILGYLKQIGNALDIFSVLSYAAMSDEEFRNSPIKVGGVLSPSFDIAGVLMQEVKEENNAYLTEALQKDLEEAKYKGLDAVRELIEIDTVNKFINYDIIEASREAVLEMTRSKFKTLDELKDYDFKNDVSKETVFLLIKSNKVDLDETKNYTIHIVEAVYYDANK